VGEIFRWEHPTKALPFTGERFTSETSGQIEIEHLHRYFLARELCRDKDVLDIASGEGYGSALIAQVARSVTGVEIDAEVVAYATAAYGRNNLIFRQGDARAIPLETASVDVVVSFETIEHLYEQEAFLAEVRRVLRPDGVFVVSTPDRDVYSPSDSPANPFHVRELTLAEFEDALHEHFAHVDCLLQRPMLGSALLPSKGGAATAPALTFERRGDEHFEGSVGLPRAVYAVALASANPVSLPAACLYIESSTTGLQLYGREAENRIAEARSDNERLEGLLADERTERERLSADNQRMEDLLGKIRSESERRGRLLEELGTAQKVLEMDLTDLRAALVRTEAARGKAVRSAAEAAWRLNQVEISTSWRLLAPVRQLGRLFPRLPRLLRRLTGG
jgi:SAM-dependent methyltransferase